jgi:ATP-dependent DNA helicase PIF1
MGHGPCGLLHAELEPPCMKDGKCTKRYPRAFVETSTIGRNTYPLYRRRNNGRTMKVKRKGKTFTLDNQWVVPYNPVLTLIMRCHINVEKCAGVRHIKYLHEYVFHSPA